MHGYSDRINHAFAFAAKYYGAVAPAGSGMDYMAHPANVAVILSRYGCEQITIVGGILHHVLEEATPDKRPVLERKIGDKFGPVALAIAKDALEPKFDRRGAERAWQARKQEYLTQLAIAEPRALDICVADEIHACGSTMTALRRLGVEYLRTFSRAGSEQTIWWYRSMLEILATRSDWPQREMLMELRLMSADLVRSAPPPIPLKPVRFLLVNDVYVADTIVGGRGGLARVATVRNRLADQGRILFVLAGDVLSPSVLSRYYNGRQMIEAFNAAKLDYATFGNHDFDIEADTLVSMIAASKFKWLSSNCTLANGSPIPKVLPWDTLRVSGHKVGLFGLTLQGPYRPEIRCTDPDSAAKRTVETLSAEGADLIVAISHQTVKADRDLLVREPRIDLVLGGHEDTAVARVVKEWNDSLKQRLDREQTVGNADSLNGRIEPPRSSRVIQAGNTNPG